MQWCGKKDRINTIRVFVVNFFIGSVAEPVLQKQQKLNKYALEIRKN